jgi:hypothetical protein
MIYVRPELTEERLARHAIPRYRTFAAEINDIRQPFLTRAVSNQHLVDAAIVGTQGFEDGQDPVDQG